MAALRLAITGLGKGPDMMQILEIIGKDEAVGRVKFALERLGS